MRDETRRRMLIELVVEYVMIAAAKRFIVEVNPEDLERLRYEFKGA